MNARFEYRFIVCPTCQIDDTRSRGRRGGGAHRDGAGEECRVVECRRCGLLYSNPFPFPTNLDELYSVTDGYFDAHPEQEEKTRQRGELIQQLEALTPGRRLLDVGAGLGETVAAACRRGWDAWGIESARSFVDKAEQLVPGRVFHGEIQNAPPRLTERLYDVIVLAAVLEHLHDPATVLHAVSRLLAPGGVLYVDVPNEVGLYFTMGNLWMRLRGRDWVVNLAPTFSPYHVFGFSRRSLTSMLQRHGLEPEVWRFYPGTPLLPFRPSLSGAAEWIGSRLMSRLGRRGELGAYVECYARKPPVTTSDSWA
jgi:2-polyprenyl-3-methyl-5-hydroxy-6-metoxy-1,4-benzoquinol methylase